MIATLAIVVLAVFSAGLASAFSMAARSSREGRLVELVDALLPQTQCGLCGYAGCRPYAEAIARGRADINRCPPGGETAVRKLAALLGHETVPLDASIPAVVPGAIARVDEALCIGCLKCVRVCPVDAILGAAGKMHTIIAQNCTGCGLCLPPCPVDCIELVAPVPTVRNWSWPQPAQPA